MLLGFLSISLFSIIALCLYLPYWLKTKHLKKISSGDLPSEGNWAKLSSGNIYYSYRERKVAVGNQFFGYFAGDAPGGDTRLIEKLDYSNDTDTLYHCYNLISQLV